MQRGLPFRRSTPTLAAASKVNYATTKGKERTRSESDPGSGKRTASSGKSKLRTSVRTSDGKKGNHKEDEVTHTAYMVVDLRDNIRATADDVGHDMRAMGTGAGYNKGGVVPTLSISPIILVTGNVPVSAGVSPPGTVRRPESHVSLRGGTPILTTGFGRTSMTKPTVSLGARRRVPTAMLRGTMTRPPAMAARST